MTKKLMIGVAIGALMVSGALAQSPSSPSSSSPPAAAQSQPAAGKADFVASQKPDQWLASKFKGTNVVGTDNQSIGAVSDILFDKTGKIEAFVVSVGGFLGVGSKEVALAPSSFDVIAGQIVGQVDQVNASLGYIKSGKVRALAVTSGARVAELPDVPTVKESGVPELENFTYETITGLFGPAKMPPEILKKLNEAMVKVLTDPVTIKRFADLTAVARPSTPEELAAMFDQHKADLAGFLTRDPRGQMIPGYLGALAESLGTEQKTLLSELDHLRKNIDHIKAYWISYGIKIAQLGLHFGADDIDGTVHNEQHIYRDAGSKTDQSTPAQELKRAIQEAGFVPTRRNLLYKVMEPA